MAQSVTIDAINNINSGDRDLTPILVVADIGSQTLILWDSVQHKKAVFDQRLTDSSRSVFKGSLICLTQYCLVSYGSEELIRILDFHIIGEEAQARIIPISALSPSQGRWAIKAKVTAKGGQKHFYFDLFDSDGGAIRVTCSDSVAHFLCDFVQVGKVYMISRAFLKPAKKNFNHLNNEWEIFLESYSTIDLCPIPPLTLRGVPIIELETDGKHNAIVDVIGVVAKVDPPVPSPRNKANMQKRSIELVDQSNGSIELTLWGEFCDKEGQIVENMFKSGLSPVLAVESARVNKGSRGTSVWARWSTQLYINPFPEAENLRSWYHKGDGRDLPFQVEEQEDRERLMLEEKELGKSRKAEKARLQAEAKAAEEALVNAELAAAAAEAKRRWDIESEALRQGLQKVDLKQILEVMKDFYENVRASDREMEERLKSVEEFKDITEGYLSIVNGIYQECGSLITGLSTKSSDLNITVITTTEDRADFHRPLNVLKSVICSHSQVTNSKLSFPSRRTHAFLSFELNCVKYRVSVNGKREVLFSRILTQIQKAHPSFKQLVLMAKAWAKRQGIYKRKSWGLSAFSLYALVIFFLQSEGLFPPLKQLVPEGVLSKLKSDSDYISGQQDLLELVSHFNQNKLPSQHYAAEMLFVRFLESFQGLAKDGEEKYISTREGLWMQKTENMVRDNLWVEDPFDDDKNLTDSTNMKHAAKISHKFESSIKIVRTGNCTTLRSMLGWDKNRYVG